MQTLTFLTVLSAVSGCAGAGAVAAGAVAAALGVEALRRRDVTLKPFPAAVAHAHSLTVLTVTAAQHGTRRCGTRPAEERASGREETASLKQSAEEGGGRDLKSHVLASLKQTSGGGKLFIIHIVISVFVSADKEMI